MINSVLSSSTFDPQNVINDKNETPLHLALKSHWKKDVSRRVLAALLKPGILDPSRRDKSGRKPLDYLREHDIGIAMLRDATFNFSQHKKHKESSVSTSKTAKSRPTASTQELMQAEVEYKDLPKVDRLSAEGKSTSAQSGVTVVSTSAVEEANYPKRNIVQEHKEPTGETKDHTRMTSAMVNDSNQSGLQESSEQDNKSKNNDIIIYKRITNVTETLEAHMKRLMSKGVQYFHNETIKKGHDNKALEPAIEKTEEKPITEFSSDRPKSLTKAEKIKAGKKHVNPLDLYGLDFDELPWEVEITAKVLKFFKDRKKTPFDIREAAAKTIYRLAEGRRNDHLSKTVSHRESFQLYEARMTKDARILWEKAISYSARLTGHSAIPVYTEVIRVWEIVLDHDNLTQMIKHFTKKIEESHLLGLETSVKYPLVPGKTPGPIERVEKVRGREKSDIPRTFILDTGSEATEHQFTPAASTKEHEYTLTTFYSFDTISCKSILLGTNTHWDFPFKEWHKEHEIIQLPYTEAILLLGRSGTGKTTCCLYRLWNEFKNFWNPESDSFRCKFPRKCLTLRAVITSSTKFNNVEEDGSYTETNTSADKKDSTASYSVAVLGTSNDSCNSAEQDTLTSAKSEDMEIVEEDLCQVFITKNSLLCDQMKKRFYKMAAAHDFLDQYLCYEASHLATNLSDVDSKAFPLFLPARKFYILLDNSLGDGHSFFKRDKDGNLRVNVISLDYDHEDLDVLLDLEHSDSGDEELGESSSSMTRLYSKKQPEQWTEVTALYFKEFIWPTISHQCGITGKEFDPLLVWIEIQSFIKGSETALRKGAHLNLEEYKQIGGRMAPNFSSYHDNIYKIFLMYQQFKQNQRHYNYLFDESELVLHLYNRLKHVRDVPWSIHSLYIDEVQDFTQAELAVLVHCCRDPNSMFFTGDTAQCIMRGISFRFQDLRSIFHRINSQFPVIKVPQKPHNLTINFRSHSEILKLAGSVIDLIRIFFKDSIDELPENIGMFHGPAPILLEPCEAKDLALLLSRFKRTPSPIEFGAHQAILVQSREAKDSLPPILKGAITLTIFEAKGLEFDDVLLYNFFTDSMVSLRNNLVEIITFFTVLYCNRACKLR